MQSVQYVAPPHMSNCTPGEQAVLAVIQAVANNSELRDLAQAVTRTLPGLQTLLETPKQPTSSMIATTQSQTLALREALSPVFDE